ncbi:uncharacterized protein LOC121419730 [Lytechinus variegatus]|uniref:uncharacterized protein LOC121419730 n=1 Tax=Lytechinus variegatus TaxID=7654 RepID=UPI001BB195E1|nr:uncharacterized protein LOC121419730 [Lytechinus variegatus]
MEKEQATDRQANCRERLRVKLKPIGKEGLVPSEIKEDLYLAEVADIAFRLLMTDVYPLASAIGISEDKLRSYKKLYLTPSNMSKGTVGVMRNMCANRKMSRRLLCDILKQNFPEIGHLLKYGYEVSHADLCDVSYGEGSKEANRIKIHKNLGIISEVTDTMNMLKYWRSLVKCPTYNWRKALAEAVYPVLGNEKALSILAGDIRRSGMQSGNVIKYLEDNTMPRQALSIAHILGVGNVGQLTYRHVINAFMGSPKSQAMDEMQRQHLRKRLEDEGFRAFPEKLIKIVEPIDFDNKSIAPEDIEKEIRKDVTTKLSETLNVRVKFSEATSNLKQVLEEWIDPPRRKALQQQERIHISDRLLKEGLIDFSLEVMLGLKPREPLNATQINSKSSQSSTPGFSQGSSKIERFMQGIMGDVKDGVVYTDVLKTIPRGSTAVLNCEFYGEPLAVYWKKGHDPAQATLLVTWMDNKIWPGLCAEDNSCEIANNYSLIIKEAQIKDEGRYICRVSNYRGFLIHDFTDLSVVEPPREPYPAIKECNNSSSFIQDFSCTITTLTTVNLTCYASGFYPKLSLFFLHGTEKIALSETKEWTNDDETRNKSVLIIAAPSERPYVCVASDLPGQHKERAVTAFVRLPEDQTSTPVESTTMTTILMVIGKDADG